MNTSQQLQTSFTSKTPAAILASFKINSRPRIALAPKLKDSKSDENDFLELGPSSLSARGEPTQSLLLNLSGINPRQRNPDIFINNMKPLDFDHKKGILKSRKEKMPSLPTLQFLEDNYQFGSLGAAESRVEINDTCMQMDDGNDSQEIGSMAIIGDSMMNPKKSKKVTFAVEVDLQQDVDPSPRTKIIKRPKLKLVSKLNALNEVSDKVFAESADLPVYDRSRPMILLNCEPRSADAHKLSNLMSKSSYKPNFQPNLQSNDRYKEIPVVKSLLAPIDPTESMKSMSKMNFYGGNVITPDSSSMNRQNFNIKLPSIPNLGSAKMFESSIIPSVPNFDRKPQRPSIRKEDIQRSRAAQALDSDRNHLRSSIQSLDPQRPKEVQSSDPLRINLRSSIQREDLRRSRELVASASSTKNSRPSILTEETGYFNDFQLKNARNLNSCQNFVKPNFELAKPSYPNLDRTPTKRSQDTTLDTETKISPNIESPMASGSYFDMNLPSCDLDIETKPFSFFLFKRQLPSQVSKLNL